MRCLPTPVGQGAANANRGQNVARPLLHGTGAAHWRVDADDEAPGKDQAVNRRPKCSLCGFEGIDILQLACCLVAIIIVSLITGFVFGLAAR